jgi:hypothetical protein
MDVSNHLLYTQRHIQISQGLLMDVPNHLLYVQRRIQISQGLLMDVPNHLLYAQRCIQISRGSRWTSLTISYTLSATYKLSRGS